MGSKAPGLGLAQVLRRHGPAYLAAHPLSVAKAKVWRAILACRTAALGDHVQTCEACGTHRQTRLPALPALRRGPVRAQRTHRTCASRLLHLRRPT